MKLVALCIFILVCLSCNQKVGGPCNYETLTQTVGVSEVIKNGDSLESVMLSGGDASSVFAYTLTSEEIKKFSEIDFQKVREASQNLEITIEKITKGTCVPYVIKKIN